MIYLIAFGIVLLVVVGLMSMRGPNIGLRHRISEEDAEEMVDAAFRDPHH